MRIDKHSNVLENVFSNFMRQVKNPSHFGFFKSPADRVEENEANFRALMNDWYNDDSTKKLNESRVNPQDYIKQLVEKFQTEGYKPYDESRIDWKQFEQIGASKESLEKNGALEQMLNYCNHPVILWRYTNTENINGRNIF